MFHEILNWFNSTAFHLFGADTSWTEVFGFVTGGFAVWYSAKVSVANFPWGIVNAFFFFALFIDAKLYADAWLQVGFLVLLVIGWVAWLKGGANRTELPVRWASAPHLFAVAVFVVAFTIFFRPILRDLDDPYPTLDALTTSMSIGAQYLLSLKYIQNWGIWIAVDLIYIPLYWAKGLTLTSIIYVVFLCMCFIGVRDWFRARTEERWEATEQVIRGEIA